MRQHLKLRSLLFLLLLSATSMAQLSVEDDITTDTVDVLLQSRQGNQGGTLIALSSVIVPGLGQHILGKPNRAFSYLVLDVGLLFGLIYNGTHARRQYENARALAWTHAGVRGPGAHDEYFWQQVAEYADVNEYNSRIELDRNQDLPKYTDEDLLWRWDDESSRLAFDKQRKLASRYQVASTFFLAFMVANRVASFIDARAISQKTNTGSLELQPSLNPQTRSLSLTINAGF